MEYQIIKASKKPSFTQSTGPSTWIEIDTNALSNNLWLYKKAAPNARFMPILKSNAYGHGIELIATFCDAHEAVDLLGVINTQEAVQLKNIGIKKDILVLSICDQLKKIVELDIATVLYDLETALELNALAKQHHKKVRVHIKVDTGLSRLGLLINEVIPFIKTIKETLHCISIEGLFTHLSKAESTIRTVTENQMHQLFSVVKQLNFEGIIIPLIHFSNSAATTTYTMEQSSIIRAGIGIYGLWPSLENKVSTLERYPWFNLQPVLTWKTKIIQIKTIQEGSYVGYDQTFQTTRTTKLAILPIGYWDGLDRKLSNGGFVLIKKQQAPILGRIAMNICMVDVTDIADIIITDEVTLLDGNTELNAELLAKKCETINYEFVARINPLIERITKKVF